MKPRNATACSALLWIGTALILAPSDPARAANEAIAFGTNIFGNDSGECGYTNTNGTEGPSDLDECDDEVDVMVDAFDDEGWIEYAKYNAAVDPEDWIDSTKDSYGEDDTSPYGSDFTDVAMLCGHGVHTHDPVSYDSAFEMGEDDSGNDDSYCKPNTRDHMEFGQDGGDLEIVILNTCQSAHYDVWTDNGYGDVLDSDGTLNTWLGFHGDSYDGSSFTNRFEDYVKDSLDNGLGDDWLDENYDGSVKASDGNKYDQCPTAVIFCETENDCDTQYEWGGFEDRFKVATADPKVLSQYNWIEDCDPLAGPALP